MPRIKLTRLIPKELVGSTELDFEEAEVVIGDTLDYYLGKIPRKPTIGEPFFLNNYKTEIVEKIITSHIFKTKNHYYKYENTNR